MPPEPLPWDRKDFFKERKHERPEPHHHHHHHPTGGGSGGGGYGGGVGGFGGGPRWREPPHPHPHPYHYGSPRWASDFRYRPPPGYGKQGGRYTYAEESSHGFVPSRSAERMSDDESCRPSGTGKYVRNSRDNRGSFGHKDKDLKGHSWDATPSPNGPGRPNGTLERQRSVDAPLRYNGTFERQRSVDAPGRPNGTFERQRSVDGPGRPNGALEQQRSVYGPGKLNSVLEQQRSVYGAERLNSGLEQQRSVYGAERLNSGLEQQRSVYGAERLNSGLEQQRSVYGAERLNSGLEQQRLVYGAERLNSTLEQQRSVYGAERPNSTLEQQRSVYGAERPNSALDQQRSVYGAERPNSALDQQRSVYGPERPNSALEQQRSVYGPERPNSALEQQRSVYGSERLNSALEQQRSVYGPERPNGTLEPQRTVPGPGRLNGTLEPQRTVTVPGRLNATFEPQRTVTVPGRVNATLEPQCTVPSPGGVNGTLEPQCSNDTLGKSDAPIEQMPVDDMIPCNSSQPPLDPVNSCDQTQFKEQQEKVDGVQVSGSSGQKLERENSIGSIDWKPLKWTRSGSLSSRGSGFSLSSSSKSLGADFTEMKVEVLPNNLSPLQSPSGDAVTTSAQKSPCEVSAAASEETSARKKPRLGWGEGLAKFEKKKVDVVDDTTPRNGTLCHSSFRDPVSAPQSTQLADQSPKINGFPECSSPATPSSVGCSSSPGLEEKQSVKSGHANQVSSDVSPSSGAVPQNHIEGSTFDLENLDLSQSSRLSFAINNLLQSGDPSAVDSGFVKSTAINKLLVWKGVVLNKLEKTVHEIDKLESELKSLIVAPDCSSLHPANPGSLPVHSLVVSREQDATSNTTHRPTPLELVSPRENDREKIPDVQEGIHSEAKNDEVDSPGSATSKFIEVLSPLRKEAGVKGVSDSNLDLKSVQDSVHKGKGGEISVCFDASQLVSSCPTHMDNGFQCFVDRDSQTRECILASNKESANRAAEVLDKLLPTGSCNLNISSDIIIRTSESDSLVKKRYLRRKRAVQFKERFITLKFRALQYLWKEDVRSLSLGKSRMKSHKKLDSSLRAVNSSSQKHRSSIRSRLSCTAGTPHSSELFVLIKKLLSDSKSRPCRDTLKMPAMVLDRKEKLASRFISSNGLVEDPCAAEKESSMINPWTPEEKEMFMDKFAAYGKDFTKIASFLAHKTTADCVEFYYKNHKFDWFKKTKKPAKLHSANNYLVASGKRWSYESNAASLDILGAASAIAAKADGGTKCSTKYMLGRSSEYNTSRGDNGLLERSGSIDVESNERETVAADVLAGICGSMSSEAMSSCTTSAVDAGESYHEWRSRKAGSLSRWPTTPEVTQNVDDESCSDESCGEMDLSPWTDEEKAAFLQAASSYGNDFTMISRCVSTRDQDQCRAYFSKAKRALGLNLSSSGCGTPVGDDDDGGQSDADEACGVEETSSVICSEKSGAKVEAELLCPESARPDPDIAVASANPEFDQSDENNGSEKSDFVDAQPLSRDLVDVSHVDDKQTREKSSSSSEPVAVLEEGCVSTPTTEEVGRGWNRTNGTDAQDDSRPVDTPADCLDTESPGPLQFESAGNNATEKETPSGLNLDLMDVEISRTCNETPENQYSVSGGLAGNLKPTDLELGTSGLPVSALNPSVQLQQKYFPVPLSLAPQGSAKKCGEVPSFAIPLSSAAVKINSEQSCPATGAGHKFIAGVPLVSSIDTSQVLLKYPALGSTNGEVKGESSLRTVTYPKPEKNIHQDQLLARESFLHRCNGFQKHTSVVKSLEPLVDTNSGHRSTRSLGDSNSGYRSTSSLGETNSGYRSSSSSDAEKPRQNGDVKLFGQILSKPSSQQKIDLALQQNGDFRNHHASQQNGDIRNHQASGLDNRFSQRFSVDQAASGIAQTKLDHHNLMGANNHPLRRYWEGSRVQTGLNPLPDSALLLAKYPDAFGNYVMPSSKMEQLPLNALNGAAAILQGRELVGSSVSAMADYQAYRSRELQRQEAVLSEMQRRNGFGLVAGVQQQQQTRGIVGQNGRRNVLVGGSSQCTSVSDPVAAMRLHYTNANGGEQRNGGSMIREEDPWRGKGNIGR